MTNNDHPKKIFIRSLFVVFILTLITTTVILAAPPTNTYNPGETLNPSCSPGDTNCTVTTPLFARTTGNVGIGTTTPNWLFQIASGTAPYLAISDSDAGLNSKHWLLSAIDGIFRIGTSSDSFTATTTYLTINSILKPERIHFVHYHNHKQIL